MYPGAKISVIKATNYGVRSAAYPAKLVLHTTETTGVPDYNNGAFAPHYTFNPKTLVWWYHGVPETHRVGTLVGSTTAGVLTNQLAIQVEIICYSDKNVADDLSTRLWVGNLSEAAKQELAKFFTYVRENYGVGTEVTPTPPGGWKSGTGASTRLSKTEWLALAGLTAHGAVPGNSHWDTGVLDLEYIAALSMEDELTPQEQVALTWLVNALASKSSDTPPWGVVNWNKYKAEWSSPPGPLDPVQHLQLAYVVEEIVADRIAAAVADIAAGTGLTATQVAAMISTHAANADAHHD